MTLFCQNCELSVLGQLKFFKLLLTWQAQKFEGRRLIVTAQDPVFSLSQQNLKIACWLGTSLNSLSLCVSLQAGAL